MFPLIFQIIMIGTLCCLIYRSRQSRITAASIRHEEDEGGQAGRRSRSAGRQAGAAGGQAGRQAQQTAADSSRQKADRKQQQAGRQAGERASRQQQQRVET